MTQFLGGFLAKRYSAKWVLGSGIMGSCVAVVLTPTAVEASCGWAIVLRAISGLFEGVAFPAMNVMWGSWAPPLERSLLCGISLAGCYLGSFIALPVWGHLGSSDRWPEMFYFSGFAGIAWCVAWLLIAGR